MTNVITSAENRLSAFYESIRRSKARCALACGIIYTFLFAVIFIAAAGKVLGEKGYLLGSDGIEQYLPFLLRLRSDLLSFFDSIAAGQPAFPMINLDYGYGMDTITTIDTDLIPMLPYYIFSVFLPESAMAGYLTGGMVILAFLSGVTFIVMCVHFGKDPLLVSAFAPVYVFSSYFWMFGWANPHFLYAVVAFPLMITGIDRIIHGKNGVLYALSVTYPALAGIHLLVYTVPFVVIFAAIRVYFVHKGRFWRSLGKYFVSGVLYTVLGVMLAGVMVLPFLWNVMQSARTPGDPNVSPAAMFIPDIKHFSRMLVGDYDPTYCYNTWIAAIPLFLYSIIRPDGKNELRSYGIAAAVLMLLPVTSYAVNGFQYDLCRWGFVPSALTAFACIEYIPVLLKPKKGDTAFMVFVCIIYLLAVTLGVGFTSAVPVLVLAAVCVVPPSRKLLLAAARGISEKVRKIPENVKGAKRYETILLIVIAAVVLAIAVMIVISGKLYVVFPAVIFAALVLAAAALTARFSGKVLPAAALVAVLFAVSGITFDGDEMSKYISGISPFSDTLYSSLAAEPREQDAPGRYSYIGDIADNVFPSDNEEKRDILLRLSAMVEKGETGYSNGSLLYDLPTAEIFNSTINGNYMRFLDRIGMDGLCLVSPGQAWGYSGKEVVYSLFGVKNLYTAEKCPHIYGAGTYRELPLEGYDPSYIYDNEYALPYGITYDKSMSQDRYTSFDPAGLPYALMNEVWLDGYDAGASDGSAEYSHECAFGLEKSLRGYSYADIGSYDNTIRINDSTAGCFLYLSFDGMRTGTDSVLVGYAQDFFIDLDNGMTHAFKILNPLYDSPWKYYMDHYTLSLGYCEEDVKELNFVSPFEYETVKLYTVPAEVYTDAYAARCAEMLHNVTTGVNTLSGSIDLSSDKILSVDLLYSPGWQAYVDGAQSPVYRANGLFLGIPLTKGSHEIKLVYHTPLLFEGAVLSLAGTAIIIAISVISAKKERKPKR